MVSKRKSNSTGSSGFTFSNLIPNVGKKLGLLGQKLTLPPPAPVYTSSTNNIVLSEDILDGRSRHREKGGDIKGGSRLSRSQSALGEKKDIKSGSRLSRSQSVRQEGRKGRSASVNENKSKIKRHHSVGSVDKMAEHFEVCSSLVELSNKMVLPGTLNGITTDLNNNVEISWD